MIIFYRCRQWWHLVSETITAQEILNQKLDALVLQHDAGEISPVEYRKQLIDAVRQTMTQLKAELGEEQFYKVYGEAGDHPEGIFGEG